MRRKMTLKRKRKVPIKFLSFLFVTSFITVLLWHFTGKIELSIPNDSFLRTLLSESNHHMTSSGDKKSVMTSVLHFFSSISLDRPTSILGSNFKGLVDDPYMEESDATLEELKKNSSYVDDPHPEQKSDEPRVYIYNTHQLENYKAGSFAEYNIAPNVMMASYILREKLGNLGVPALVETGNVTEMLNTNNWNYASSYRVTKMFMESAKKEHSSIEYFIDVHRDSAKRNITYKEIDGKPYARILFIVGLENKDYEKNLAVTSAINQKIERDYPGLSRGIYKKEGPGVDGVYNQDISPKVILAELGGVDNTIEEVLNTIEVFAKVLSEYMEEHP